MKLRRKMNNLVLTLMTLLIISCAEKAKEETVTEAPVQTKEEAKKESPKLDPALNPLAVYGDYTKVFADTLEVQMYELILKPGDSIGYHGHLDHTVYVIQGGKAVVYMNGTDPVEMNLETGQGFIAGPMTDVAKNVGDTEIQLLIFFFLLIFNNCNIIGLNNINILTIRIFFFSFYNIEDNRFQLYSNTIFKLNPTPLDCDTFNVYVFVYLIFTICCFNFFTCIVPTILLLLQAGNSW